MLGRSYPMLATTNTRKGTIRKATVGQVTPVRASYVRQSAHKEISSSLKTLTTSRGNGSKLVL
jgi:hypothetical protein